MQRLAGDPRDPQKIASSLGIGIVYDVGRNILHVSRTATSVERCPAPTGWEGRFDARCNVVTTSRLFKLKPHSAAVESCTRRPSRFGV